MAICKECGTGLEDELMAIARSTGGGRPIVSKAHAVSCDDSLVYTPDELEFLKAMDRYKRDNRRPFPTWSEVFAVFTSLGYRKEIPHG